jgi:hypothetical protein
MNFGCVQKGTKCENSSGKNGNVGPERGRGVTLTFWAKLRRPKWELKLGKNLSIREIGGFL